MSSVATQSRNNLAGKQRRSLSGQGGLLNRMFGSSSDDRKDAVTGDGSQKSEPPQSPMPPSNTTAIEESKDEVPNDMRSPTRKSTDEPTSTDKKRRSSGVGRARDLFSSAKASLHSLGGSPDSKSSDRTPQTPMQRLGKMDPALSVPTGSLNNSAGESHPGPRSTFRVGVTEDKNKKCRRTMEDTHAYLYNFLSTPAPALGSDNNGKSRTSQADSTTSALSEQGVVETDNGYFAIFDGHAGTFAAEWCGKKVHILLEEIIRKHPNTPIPELLDMTFTSVDQQLEKLPLKNSGCTAVIAVLRWEDRIPNSQSATGSTAIAPAAAQAVKGESQSSETDQAESKLRETASRQRVLYTANVGDARIVLCRNGKALRLSYDHKGSDENEGKRIAGAGGLILNNRVNGVLAVTRALGDAYMKDLVTGHPYTTETVIQPEIDEFLILACDGLWDVCSDQEAVDLVRTIEDPQTAAKALVDHALARFSTDNLSCMVVRFDSDKVQETAQNKTDPIGVEGDPATKPGGLSEAEHIVLDAKKKLDESGIETLDRVPTEEIERQQEHEPGPELNADALEAAKKKAAANS
ncbi:mgpp2cl-1, protein phosphatase 2C-like protein 1 [Saxophila tyrrhenica]|uniref:Mgpp2cl-1, protein phosphatase 2C-like protein 1 n=1 Tax=Saxophila tyrrhenica TaxID=1690608 RepID=A0AAV9P7P5_9PEZI|nr:mgpp2cl-1, protein phosphatase 2C-like protein 1 [Saxophila tyrrhenica]